jgi:hypothetical protein
VTAVTPTERTIPIAESVDRLLEGAEQREAWKTADSLSGSHFERVVINGVPLIVKYISVDDDWIMRATGDLSARQLTLVASGVLDSLPASIDHTIVGCAPFTGSHGHRGVALLMRDVSAALIPSGSEPIAIETHRGFIEDMATLHATYWGFRDDAGLFPLAHHYVYLTPAMAELEAETPRTDPVPPAVADGWRRLSEEHPQDASRLLELARDPWPLVVALRQGPQTLIHADWKLGNLGRDGSRTILLDWDRTGEAPPLVDLAWYLAVNCDRLPESKEDTISAYRSALESAGIATTPWWDGQLAPALAGAFLQLAWSKTGDASEFGWWSERVAAWNP